MIKTETGNMKLLQEMFTTPKFYKELNKAIGIDFNKKWRIYRYCGSFTVNKLLKTFYIANNETAFIMIKRSLNDYIYCQIDNKGNINFDVNNQVCDFSKFYAKSSFENYRKKSDIMYLIICNKEDLTLTSDKYNGYNAKNKIEESLKNVDMVRYRIIETSTCYYPNEQKSYLNRCHVNFYNANTNNHRYTNVSYYKISDISEVFDKSGYNILGKRDLLKQEVNKIKAIKEKEKVMRADFTKELQEIEENIKTQINKSHEMLQKYFDISNMEKYDKILQDLKSFSWEVSWFSKQKTKIINKDFNNITTINNGLNSVRENIEKFNKQLQYIEQNY